MYERKVCVTQEKRKEKFCKNFWKFEEKPPNLIGFFLLKSDFPTC